MPSQEGRALPCLPPEVMTRYVFSELAMLDRGTRLPVPTRAARYWAHDALHLIQVYIMYCIKLTKLQNNMYQVHS